MILVDDREPKPLIRQLQTIGSALNVEVICARQDYGDFILCPGGSSGIQTIGIERKTVGDMLSSRADERLGPQLLGLQSTWGIGYLLIEGHRTYTVTKDERRVLVHHGTEERWGFASIENYIANIQLSGIRVMQFGTQTDSLNWIVAFYRMLAEKDGRVEVLETGRMKDRSIPASVAALCQVPRLGPRLGKVLIERFGSVAGVCQATDKELRAVPDLGPILLKSIRDTLGHA
jgi:ERCC4-type nuclease